MTEEKVMDNVFGKDATEIMGDSGLFSKPMKGISDVMNGNFMENFKNIFKNAVNKEVDIDAGFKINENINPGRSSNPRKSADQHTITI